MQKRSAILVVLSVFESKTYSIMITEIVNTCKKLRVFQIVLKLNVPHDPHNTA